MEFEKYENGNIVFFLDAPVIKLEKIGDRVMPLKNISLFVKSLSSVPSFVGIDDRFFWVSGNYEIYFKVKRGQKTAWLEKQILIALANAGGFETAKQWMRKHKQQKNGINWIGLTKTSGVEYR